MDLTGTGTELGNKTSLKDSWNTFETFHEIFLDCLEERERERERGFFFTWLLWCRFEAVRWNRWRLSLFLNRCCCGCCWHCWRCCYCCSCRWLKPRCNWQPLEVAEACLTEKKGQKIDKNSCNVGWQRKQSLCWLGVCWRIQATAMLCFQ